MARHEMLVSLEVEAAGVNWVLCFMHHALTLRASVSRPGSRAIDKRMLVMLRSGLWHSAEIDLMASARPERSVSRPVVCQVEVLAFSVMVRFRAYARDNA